MRRIFSWIIFASAASLMVVAGCSESGNEPTTPKLVPDPAAIEFEAFFGGPAPNTYVQVGVRNVDTIEYRISTNQNWVEIPSGTRKAPDSFFVKVFSNDMQPGVNTATLTLQSINPVGIALTIPITVDIGPALKLSPRYFSFEATRESTTIANQSFEVTTNDPVSDFDFGVESLASWIVLESDTGTTPGTVTFSLDLTQAVVGDQIGQIRVSSQSVANPPQLVTCSLSVFSWLSQTSPFQKDLRSVYFHDNQLGWAAGIVGGLDESGYLIRTVNGGATWQLYPELDFGFLQSLDFVDASNGWAVGTGGLILHTTDGGDNWIQQNGSVTVDLWDVGFASPDSGMAVGRDGTAGYTTDGGANWHFTSNIVGYSLSAISVVSNQHAWVVGNYGAILRTSNGGQSWTVVSLGVYGDLWGVMFVDASTGWLVGEAGSILHTSDGGTTWQAQTSNTTKTLYSVNFVDNLVGWAVGEDGTILYTLDGGEIWQTQYGGIDTYDLYDVSFVDQSYGWIVGQFGTILYSPAGGN